MRFTNTSSMAGAIAVSPTPAGTKAAAYYQFTVPPGGSVQVATATDATSSCAEPFADFDDVFAARIDEADEFYDAAAARHRQTPTSDWCSGRRSPA